MMFSCMACEHGKPLLGFLVGYKCCHPAVEKMRFSTDKYQDFIQSDVEKVSFLISKILRLKLDFDNYQTETFMFPFIYEPAMINDCRGFKKNE